MQPGGAQRGGMRLGALLTLLLLLLLLLCSRIEGQESSSTINHILMESVPDWMVSSGQNLTLKCIMNISTTSPGKRQRTVLFYREDEMIHNVSSRRNVEKIVIPQIRVYQAGIYRCTVILNKQQKTSQDYIVTVTGVPRPKVILDKTEVTEGEEVAVTCAVEEERGPIHFIIEKFEVDEKIIRQKKEKTSQDNLVTINFPTEDQDYVLVFFCKAVMHSGRHLEFSETTRSDLLPVWDVFSVPKVQVRPRGRIREGNQLLIRCTVQLMPWTLETPKLIIQKDKEILLSRYCNSATYRVIARAEHSGNYTCKAESGGLSKVSSVVVKVEEKTTAPKSASP